MPLSYQDKLKIFHDNFVKYAFNYIERQKAMALGQEVSVMTTPFKEVVGDFRIVPIIGFFTELGLKVSDLWSGRLYSSSANIKNLFPISEITIKQMLSTAIQEIAVHVEEHLNQLQDEQKIGAFATDAVLKLITCLKNRDLYKITEITSEYIVTSILNKNSWFSNDNFLSQGPRESGNYYFISETELKANFHEFTTFSILTLNTAVETPLALTTALREKIPDIKNKHIIIYTLTEASFQYISLERHSFTTDIDSLRIDSLEAKIADIIEEKKADERYFNNIRNSCLLKKFVGRETILQEIYNGLKSKKIIEVIGGLGGMGKTQTILKYIETHEEAYNYRVRWFPAETKASLNQGFREFAKILGMKTETISDQDVIKFVIYQLNTEIKQSLLVFDNVEDPDLIREYLLDINGPQHHHILITTRNFKNYKEHDNKIIVLEAFTDSEAIQFVQMFISHASERDALELASLFDKIPLGLSQCLAYIDYNKKDKDIKKYIELYRSIRSEKLPENLHSEEREELDKEYGHKKNIYATIKISLDGLSSFPKALEMFKITSFLDADDIPLSLFDSFFCKEVDDREELESLAILQGYSLIKNDVISGTKFIYIHRVVQETTRAYLCNHRLLYLQKAMDLIHSKMAECSTWYVNKISQQNGPLEIHALSLIQHFDRIISRFTEEQLVVELHETKLLELKAELMDDCANLYSVRGDIFKALAFYEESLRIKQSIYNSDHPGKAFNLYHISYAHFSLGRLEEALDECQEALRLRRLYLQENDANIPVTIHQLGNIFSALKLYHEALNMYQEALSYRARIFGDNSHQVAATAHEIAGVYCIQGRHEEALERYSFALPIRQKELGLNHPSSASTINGIGDVLFAQGKYEEAFNNYNEALRIRKEFFGDKHPQVASTLCSLANLHRVLENKQMALELFNQALEILLGLFDKNHPKVISIINSIQDLKQIVPSDVIVSSIVDVQYMDKDKTLLESIENVKNFIGEKEISESSGLSQYIYNSLSNNQFTKSSKQLIEYISSFINSIEKLINMSEYYLALGMDINQHVTLLWEQLDLLIEFAESGQKFVGARPPHFDPGDDGPSGGSGGLGEESNHLRQENNTETALLVLLPGQFNTNTTMYTE